MSALVTSATSATVSVSWTNPTYQCQIAVWESHNLLEQTPTDAQSDTGNTGDVVLNVPVKGLLIAAATTDAGGSNNISWTNLIEDYDVAMSGVENASGGAGILLVGDPTQAIRSDSASGPNHVMVATSFK